MGGGGNSGSVALPRENAVYFTYMMTGAIPDATNDIYMQARGPIPSTGFLYHLDLAVQNNMYAGIDAFNVDPDLQTIQDQFDEYGNLVDGLVEENYIDNIVSEQEIASRRNYYKSYNTIASQYAEINAVNSSAFAIAVAILESERNNELNKLRVDMKKEIRVLHLDHMKTMAALQFEITKAAIVAKVDEHNADIDFNVKEAIWAINMYQEGSKMIAATSGAYTGGAGKEPNKIASALAGGLSGAAAGAGIGTAVPGIGPGLGAGIGGLVGIAGGLMS